ncbi:MAG: hypothetical protein VKQ33_13080 [Candidatus Sericytochromatia bacterium]|nr:hypothetical protein [Candidatus Sericytochromatia bacterium]
MDAEVTGTLREVFTTIVPLVIVAVVVQRIWAFGNVGYRLIRHLGLADAARGSKASHGRTATGRRPGKRQDRALIEAVQGLTGLGSREAKHLVEAMPNEFARLTEQGAQGLQRLIQTDGKPTEMARLAEQLKRDQPWNHDAPGGTRLEKVGRDAKGAGGAPARRPSRAGSPREAVTAWDVVLLDPGVRPDRALTALEEVLGLPREAAEEAVMAAPGRVVRGVTREQAEGVREALEVAGAQVAVRAAEG